MQKDMNKLMAEILGLIHLLEDPVTMEAAQQAALARHRVNIARRNARFANMLANATDIQVARMSKFESDGSKVVKAWQSRSSGKIAVMMQKEGVWNQATGRISTKLTMVYPDGRNQEAFGKVPLHEDWIK